MDALYQLREGSVHDVLAQMTDPPNYNSVRVILGILEEKGFVTHRRDGKRFIYQPRESAPQAARSATAHLLKTFYRNSPTDAVATLLDISDKNLSDEELDELSALIEEARRRRSK